MFKRCDEEYDITSEECFACKDKKECVEEYAKKISEKNSSCLFFKKDRILHCESMTGICSERQIMACRVVRSCKFIIFPRPMEPCKNFGTPHREKKEKCISCDLFSLCEIHDFMMRNPKMTIELTRQNIDKQLRELREEIGGCYGNFLFEKTCWEDCDFTIRCLKESGIIPGRDCGFFNIDKGGLSEECNYCLFSNSCKKEWECFQKELMEKREAKKMFITYFSLKEIRDEFLTEEGEL